MCSLSLLAPAGCDGGLGGEAVQQRFDYRHAIALQGNNLRVEQPFPDQATDRATKRHRTHRRIQIRAQLTGESVPVDKRPVDDVAKAAAQPDKLDADRRVFAGTINGGGALEIQATRLASDTALARVVRMVSEAETQKSPTQRFTDRFERIFVPAVLGFVMLLMFTWVVIDEPFRDSFYRTMAVLVAASPRSLAIAIPSAVLSGVARAARGGVLVKGGGPLENLGALGAIAFDKISSSDDAIAHHPAPSMGR